MKLIALILTAALGIVPEVICTSERPPAWSYPLAEMYVEACMELWEKASGLNEKREFTNLHKNLRNKLRAYGIAPGLRHAVVGNREMYVEACMELWEKDSGLNENAEVLVFDFTECKTLDKSQQEWIAPGLRHAVVGNRGAVMQPVGPQGCAPLLL